MTHQHDDDQPVGHILNRRQVLKLFGGGGLAALVGISLPAFIRAQSNTPTPTPVPSCVVRPELTEGPLFIANELNRADLRLDPTDDSIRAGTLLQLVFNVSDVTGGACAPLPDAQVDVWHCDAAGVYSGFDGDAEALWLRGYQMTDADGVASFITIVPGWYPGRAVHIHFKVITTGADDNNYEFTSQLFFDPEQIETAYTEAPYTERGLPNVSNEREGIVQRFGDLLILDMETLDAEALAELDADAIVGYRAVFEVGLDLTDTRVGAGDSWGRR